jgi:hypothetical protein
MIIKHTYLGIPYEYYDKEYFDENNTKEVFYSVPPKNIEYNHYIIRCGLCNKLLATCICKYCKRNEKIIICKSCLTNYNIKLNILNYTLKVI